MLLFSIKPNKCNRAVLETYISMCLIIVDFVKRNLCFNLYIYLKVNSLIILKNIPKLKFLIQNLIRLCLNQFKVSQRLEKYISQSKVVFFFEYMYSILSNDLFQTLRKTFQSQKLPQSEYTKTC